MTSARHSRSPAVEAVEQALGRIAEVDPLIRSVCALAPDARAVAAGLDAERAAGRVAARCTASRSCSRTTSTPPTG